MRHKSRRPKTRPPTAHTLTFRKSALPVALALFGTYAQAQTNPNEVAQAAIAAISQIATSAANAEIAKANATIALAQAGGSPAADQVVDVEAIEVVETSAALEAPATAALEPIAIAEPQAPVASEPAADVEPEPLAAAETEPSAAPEPEPTAAVESEQPAIPEPVVVAKPEASATPEPVIVAEREAPVLLEPIAAVESEASTTPESAAIAELEVPDAPEPISAVKSEAPAMPAPVAAEEREASAAAEPVPVVKPEAPTAPEPAAAAPEPVPVVVAAPQTLVVPEPVAGEEPESSAASEAIVAGEPEPLAAAEPEPPDTPEPEPPTILKPAAVVESEPPAVPERVVVEKPNASVAPAPVAAVEPEVPATSDPVVAVAKPEPPTTPTPVARTANTRVAITQSAAEPVSNSVSKPISQPAPAPAPAPVAHEPPAPLPPQPLSQPQPQPDAATVDVATVNLDPQIHPDRPAIPTNASPSAASAHAVARFNTNLLAFPVDVDMFAEGNPVPAGDYRVDVYLNDSWEGKRSIHFETQTPGDRIAQPCFTAELLERLGFDLEHPDPDILARLQTGQGVCAPLDQIITHTQSRFDVGLQRLDIQAPQVALLRQARGYVDPSRWDAGIAAATLHYDYNVWHMQQGDVNQTSHYLGLRSGVNLGAWRLRHRGTFTRSSAGKGLQYRSSAFYVERALPSLGSTITLGDATTRSHAFESLAFRGVILETEDSMRPDALRGFAPVINGIAQSNARVSVTQMGVQIFETTVPPGPFVLDDLYPNGNSGDLLVTITEADGSEHSFTVTNNALPELLRPGVTNYSVSAGRYRNASLSHEPLLTMANVSRGLTNTVTAYGGVLAAGGYRSASLGVGLNLPVGAVTLDATVARTSGAAQGVGLRLGYSRRMEQSKTDITLAMLRHATSGYYEPTQAFQILDGLKRGEPFVPRQRTRSQLSLYLNQGLPGTWRSVSFAGSIQDYWQRPGRDAQFSIAYGRALGRLNLNMNAMRSRNAFTGRWDNQVMVSVSMPLGADANPVNFHTSLTQRSGSQNLQTGISGALGERRQHVYSVYATADRARRMSVQTSGGASVGTTTSVARLNANVGVGAKGSRQLGMSASGGVVMFKDGVVFTPDLGETVGIVQARGAKYVRVAGYTGAHLDARGHAIASWLQPYRENDVRLDPKGADMDVELVSTSQKVAPTRGAVVLLPFETRRGYAILTTLRRRDGSFAPFAAGVFDAEGRNVGYVAQGGQALIRVDGEQGELTVRWGAQAEQQCRFAYDMNHVTNAGTNAVKLRQGDQADQTDPADPPSNQPDNQVGAFRRAQALCS